MSGDDQIAAELREIATEMECPQRKMHLEMAAQIVEQGRFMHPNDFGMQVEIDSLRYALASIQDNAREALKA